MHPRTRRQKEVYDYIVRYIERHGHEPSYQVIARQLGVSSKAGIGKHVKALEDQGLLLRKWENRSFRLLLSNGHKAAAPEHAIDWLEAPAGGREPEDFESEPFAVPQFVLRHLQPSDVRAFRVPDDGMSGRNICEGDIALIEKRRHFRDGDCLAVTINDEDTLLRTFYRDGASVELRPDNEQYDPLVLGGDSVEIQGVFRALIRPF